MIQKYKEWLQNIKRLSPNTVRSYVDKIQRLSEKVDIEKLDEEEVNKFLGEHIKEKSKSTFNVYINAINSFAEFSKKKINTVKQVVVKNNTPNYITEKELNERLIHTVEYWFDRDVFKMKVLLTFMFYTGARISDIVKLRRKDIDFDNKYVTFRNGKGEKDRDVPLLDMVIELLDKYFNVEPEDINAFNITASTLASRFRHIQEILGDIKISPHTLRHSYAMWFLHEFGGSITLLQKYMGHNDIKTTMKYLNIKNKDNLEIFKRKEKEWKKKRRK